VYQICANLEYILLFHPFIISSQGRLRRVQSTALRTKQIA